MRENCVKLSLRKKRTAVGYEMWYGLSSHTIVKRKKQESDGDCQLLPLRPQHEAWLGSSIWWLATPLLHIGRSEAYWEERGILGGAKHTPA